MEKKELIYYRLDEVDEKILAMLQDNARVSLKDIGAEVSMSPTAVGTRIDRYRNCWKRAINFLMQ